MHKNSNQRTTAAITLGVLVTTFLAAAPGVFAITVFSPASGDFNSAANWNAGVPGNNNVSNTNAIIQNGGQVATTSGDYNANTAAVLFDWNLVPRGGGALTQVNINHNLETGATLGTKAGFIFLNTSGGTAAINQAAGTTVTTGNVNIGRNVAPSATEIADYNLSGTLDANLITIERSGQLNVGATGYTDDPINVNSFEQGSITATGIGGELAGAITLSQGADFRGSGLTLSGGVTSAADQSLSLNGKYTVNTNPIDLNAGTFTLTSNSNNPANASELNIGGNDWDLMRINFQGYITMGGANFLPSDAGVEFGWVNDGASSGTLDLGGFDQTVTFLRQTTIFPAVNGDQNVTGGGTLTINQSSGTADYHGRITDGGTATSLVKNGAGTQILNNLSGTPTSYTGTTILNAGTLLINGDHSAATGAVTVNGGTLGGIGTLGGNVTVNAGGALSPGMSPGTMTLGGDLDISAIAGGAPGELIFELGAVSDLVQLTSGTLSIGSGLLDVGDFSLTVSQVGLYTVFDTTAPVFGSIAATGFQSIGGSLLADLRYADGINDLALLVIPEPASIGMLGLFGLLVMLLRRIRG